MKLREIKQHHLPAIISIAALITLDSVSFYCAYYATNYISQDALVMKYPLRVFATVIFLLYLNRRYNPVPTISRALEMKKIIQLIYSAGIGYIIYKILTKTISIDKAHYDLVFLHLFIFLDLSFRLVVRSVQKLFLKWGIGGRETVIVGSGTDAIHIANEVKRNLTLGYKLKGYFAREESSEMNHYSPYLGKINVLENKVKKAGIREVIIALKYPQHETLLEIFGQLNSLAVCMKIIPDMYESITGQARVNMLTGIPLLDINPDIITEFQKVSKRVIDLLISTLSLAFLLPINILIGIFIKSTSRGNIIYSQVRVGQESKKFTLHKFRTMYENSEDVSGPVWAQVNDPRITAVGKILRKYRLDEIPQLYNVLKGNMSLVGPRPERPHFVQNLMKEIPYYKHRLSVKPGITGWAQVVGPYDKSLDDVSRKLKLDFFYIENLSLLLDLKILFHTIWIILKGKGH